MLNLLSKYLRLWQRDSLKNQLRRAYILREKYIRDMSYYYAYNNKKMFRYLRAIDRIGKVLINIKLKQAGLL